MMKFRIKPKSDSFEISLSFKVVIKVKAVRVKSFYDQNFYVSLQLDALTEPKDEYVQPFLMIDEAIYYMIITIKLCQREIYLLILSTIVFLLIVVWFILMIYYNLNRPVIRASRKIVYYVNPEDQI
ncbi:hypothetical protein RF11_14933 [Thelohanellus kitauei]|uniref:Uncharacterized protein n=1 Tax=Thelohanellus kitauei TaxID=669202 RepID=A0A0C2N2C7_THEKT|nr:hypothetical protein RF11_14933 [Thelohanellus kitauei]